MPPDYSGQNLRGKSFKGQNLENADFSEADICGANFTGANLRRANFTGAKAGLQKRWVLLLVVLSWLMSGILGFLSLFNGVLIAIIFDSDVGIYSQLVGWVALILTPIIYIMIIRQGVGVSLAFGGVFAVIFTFVFAVAFAFGADSAIAFAVAFAVAFAGVFAVALAFAFAVAFAVAGAFAFVGAFAFAGVFTFAFAKVVVGGVAQAFVGTFVFGEVFGVAFAIAGTFVGAYVAWLAMNRNDKYTLVKNAAVALAAIGGTSFRRADLTDTDFISACLKSTDFRKAELVRTCFQKTKLLDRVRPGNSYLQYPQIRKLILTGQGQDKNFNHFYLQGINLKSAFLTDTSFIGTDLSEACLQDADLSRAILKQTQLDNTDFTGATLTGAIIEDWNITRETNFRNVRCEYVYMRLPTKENREPLRKPDNNAEVFADGEFGDFIQPIFDTLDFYHRQNVDPRAIAISFKRLAENNPDAELEIVAIERRGEDKILIRVKTATTANKSELSKEYFIKYNQLKSLVEKDFKALITEKESQISRLENMIKTAFERPSFYIESYNNQGDINMAGDRKIETGGGNYNESGTYNEHIEGDSNRTNHHAGEQKQTLADAATEIQALLEQLDKTYSTDTTTGKMALATEAIAQIENNPSLTARILSALKVGGVKAFEQFLSHPAASFVIGALEDWEKTKEN